MWKNGYIICFQTLNLERTQVLITRSSYLQKFAMNILPIPYEIIKIYSRTLPSACFNVQCFNVSMCNVDGDNDDDDDDGLFKI